ncbi:MAG: hypothetical protein MUO40_11560, partial [Anaerolineaceae bacterium]|nr:hypothetical protein [Anaerolineaceae bacterium]
QVPGINDIKRSNRLLEKYCIGYLVNDPESLYLLNRNLQKVQLSIITVEDFIETDFLEVYKLITDSLEQDEYAPRDYVEMYLPDTISEAIESGKENIETGEIKADKEISEVIRIILRMRRNRIDEHLNELLFAQNELNEDEHDLGYTYQSLILEEIKLRKIIDDALQPPRTSGKL